MKEAVPLRVQKNETDMNSVLKYLGIILVLAGVVCLAVYEMAVPSNALLVTALILEAVGIIGFAVINRFVDN